MMPHGTNGTNGTSGTGGTDRTLPSPCTCTALRKAARRLSQRYDAALATAGLTSAQYAILAELDHGGSAHPSLRELAHAMVMDRSTMGHNLRPLARDGLIALHPGTSDRRSKQVALTAHGNARLAEARGLWSTAQARFDDDFGASNAAVLRDVLLAIAAGLPSPHALPLHSQTHFRRP
jgi:DNA-binding MarR family transcriptional regulator